MTADVRVGLDLGTSGLKGVALDAEGVLLARGHHAYPTHRPEPGAAEQEPGDWLVALASVVEQLRADVDSSRWAGIGLSAMIPTLVTVDADGEPTGRAVTWEDARAEEHGDALRERIGADELYRRSGQWVDGRYLLPMWDRLAALDPERAARTSAIWGAKDFLVHHLTGTAVTDPSTATGFGCFDLATGTWSRALGEPSDVALPTVMRSDTRLPLRTSISARLELPGGLAVSVGAADSVLGAWGMGVTTPGDIAYVAGTSTVVLGVADEHVLDEAHRFLVTPMADIATYGLEMDLLATGSAFRWLAGVLGLRDEAQLLSLASSADPEAGPLVLPYVAPGEQGALWDPSLSGAFLGLHTGHGPGDLALGLVQGIVVESRRCVQVLEACGFGPGPLRVAGGSAADRWFRQQLADATGRDVLAPLDGESDYSAIGAALLVDGGAPAPAARMTATSPDPSAASRWEGLAARLDVARAAAGHPL